MGVVPQVPTSPPQRVCPRCSTVGHTAQSRCPWCGAAYRRRPLLGLAALLALFALLVLGGVAAMLALAAREADRRVDREVRVLREEVENELGQIEGTVRRELETRLPAVPPAP
jgi:hypothetical protein